MVDINDVAKWFLSKQAMPNKKLQKLCYYAQAWYCALYDGTPLFEDEIQAGIHGPVVPALYGKYKNYKWKDIPMAEFDESIFNNKTLDILNAVNRTYGNIDCWQLEVITHSEAPWQKARGDLEPWEPCKNPISCKDMREYYAEEHKRSQKETDYLLSIPGFKAELETALNAPEEDFEELGENQRD